MAYNFNTSPYYDDYDADNRFLKILFNPGRAVQARELTQIQSVLQNQLSSGANHIWKNGANVVGGEVSLNHRTWLQLATADTTWINRVVYGTTSNAVGVVEQLHDDETQPVYYIRLLSGTFDQSEVLETYDTVCNGGIDEFGACIDNSWYDQTALFKTGQLVANGKALEAKVGNGVYWIDNYFVPVLSQTIFLDPVSDTPTCKVGFDIIETIVDSTTDQTLLDPASGFYNQNAPGADRYQVTLKLTKEADSEVANKFTWMMDVTGGAITTEYERSDYSLLSNEMARRTHDESGNYTLNPFPLELKDNTDPEKYTVKVEPSKAYIAGYEHELLVPLEVEATRARTTRAVPNDHITPEFGPYIEIESADKFVGVFDVFHKEKLVFLTTNGDIGSKVGVSKRVTHVTKVGTMFRLYLENSDGLDSIAAAIQIASESNPTLRYAEIYTPTGGVVLKGVNYPWLYKMTDVTSSVTNGQVTFSTQKNYETTMTGGVVNVPAGFIEMHWERVLYIYNANTNAIIPQNGTTSTGDTWIADLTGNENAIISIVDQAGVVSDAFGGHTIHIMADMYMSEPNWRSVTPYENTAFSVDLFAEPDSELSIFGEDVLLLPHGITEVLSITAPDTTSDVTDDFILWSTDIDTTLQDARLVYSGDPLAMQLGTYIVHFKAHQFGSTASATYFTVNSYTEAAINYGDIGIYQGTVDQTLNRLSDVLDFRTTDEDYSIGTYLPLPESSISVSYEYYQPRRDRLTINDDGIINIQEGFPSDDPILPTAKADEMTLYTMYVPPYTYDSKNVNVAHVKNKRYTMQDIRGLDERLNNLEYYTALNLLEKSTASMQVVDEHGFERYKNGMLIDPFHDHGIGDITNEDYYVSIFPEAGICTTPFTMSGLDFEAGVMSGIRKNNLTYTLDFNVIEGWIAQENSSQVINLNPYARKSWIGFVTLSPSSDTWFEELYVPDVIVQNENNNAVTQARVDYGTQTRWNAWQTTWSGWRDTGGKFDVEAPGGIESVRGVGNRGRLSGGFFGGAADINWQWDNGLFAPRHHGITRQRRIWRETTRRAEAWSQQQQQQTDQVRTGERSWIQTNDIRTEVGDLVIDTSAIEWMRSKNITVEAHKLKPNTQMHFRFDGVIVDDYVTPNGGAPADPVLTDAYGRLDNVVFTIPSEPTGVRFRTGSKVLEVMDSFDSDMTTQGNSVFTSAGTLKTREKTILSTLQNVTVTEALSDNQTSTQGTRTVRRGGGTTTTVESKMVTEWYDPVSESFLVAGEDGGVFVDSIDVYFWSKDAEGTPVRIEIRPMENGYPTPTPIPMASVFIYPNDIITSIDGTANTRFQFADPIYLMNDTEYCFVLISDSLDYNIFISELGETDLSTGERIGSQPYLGSMFTSQNNTTWTAEQNKDVKFRINKCSFNTNVEATVQLDMIGFEGTKTITSFTPNFSPMVLQGTNVSLDAIVNGDINDPFTGAISGEDIILEQQVVLDGSNTIDSGYVYTPISYISTFSTTNANISPVINSERMSTVVQNNVVFETAMLADGITDDVKNQKGIYVSKPIQLSNPADDLIMWLSIQEVANTFVKVYYDTGTVIPRYIDTEVVVPGDITGYGDYDVNDFEEQYAWVYAADASPYSTITNDSAVMSDWNGIVGSTPATSFVSTSFVDGDDDPANLTRMHLADISNINGIVESSFISRYNLDGAGFDVTNAGVGTDLTNYAVDDIWFGSWDDNLDRHFWRKIVLPDNTLGKEQVPVLILISNDGSVNNIAVIEEDALVWREMKDSGNAITNPTILTNMEFVEHTFKPLKKVVAEFNSFRIKVELHTTNPCYLPAIRELRVLALT
jgi:hypothetical protein